MTNARDREDRRAAMEQFEASWQRLRERFSELAEQDRAGQRRDGPVAVAQAMAHVAHWDEAMAHVLDERRAGRDIGEQFRDRDGEWNARWLADDLYLSLEDAQRRLDEAHAARRAALESLDDELWDAAGRDFVAGGINHYEDHFAQPFEFPVSRDVCMNIFEQRWRDMRARFDALADNQEQAASGAVPVGAAIMHVARWDEASVEVIRARRADASAPDPYAGRDKEWNARWLAGDGDADAGAAVDRLEAAHEDLANALGSLDDEAWKAHGVGYALGTAEHYRSHTEAPLEFPLPPQGDGDTT